MTEEAILRGIHRVLREHLGIDREVPVETQIGRDLRLDSLQRLTLVVELESYFRISFADGDDLGLESLRDLARLIGRRLQERNGSDPCT